MKSAPNGEYSMKTLRLILGDQLNEAHSWFESYDPECLYIMLELAQEQYYVKHHKQKVAAFFLAMRHFCQQLRSDGHKVSYWTLEETQTWSSLEHALGEIVKQYGITNFDYQRPDEYRLVEQLRALRFEQVTITEYDTEHFLLPFEQINRAYKKYHGKQMEFFYRDMRRKHQVLVDEHGKPQGGQWNFDKNNRAHLKKKVDQDKIPKALAFNNQANEIYQMLDNLAIPTFGQAMSPLIWPVNRSQAKTLLAHFCRDNLPYFGQYQDAMLTEHKHKWSLFHSRLSFAINVKLLHPLEVIEAAITAGQHNPDIDIAQVEGFVRQILGWREYVRMIYWALMPEYSQRNSLHSNRRLPGYFWHGKTKMQCLKQSISQSLEYAYAHHIQRLMIIGNWSLLTGLETHQVEQWYLGVYIDAIEWVEMPNTKGMALFADEETIATKPYAASGAYINKMSDYCKNCHYKVKESIGDQACPFNSLYWHFIDRHQARFADNHRMKMMYHQWSKKDPQSKQALLDKAEQLLIEIEEL